MNVIDKNEGQKITYSLMGNWINFDDQIMLNLEKLEEDAPVHIDVMANTSGKLSTSDGQFYVAQVDIPARAYTETEVENLNHDEEDESSQKKTIIKEAVPFSIENVTLSLFALKEGVFDE